MIFKVTFGFCYLNIITWCLWGNTVYAHYTSVQAHQYIKKYRDLAIAEMFRTGIPASIKLAQGLFESQNGNSTLAIKANNHFGVKCKEDWTGDTIKYDDDAPQECFRKYQSAEESFIDHSNILQQRDRYATLFMLSPTDYKGWAKGLKEAGYATLPNYAEKIIDIIERYNLQEYDMGGMPEYIEPAIAEKLKTGETTSFVALGKRAKPKRSTTLPNSDLASLDKAFNQSMEKRPNIPLQQLSGAPTVMPYKNDLKNTQTRKQNNAAMPNKSQKANDPVLPAEWEKVSDILSEKISENPTTIAMNQLDNKQTTTQQNLPIPPNEPTPNYLKPQYKHQSIMLLKSDKNPTDLLSQQNKQIEPNEIVTVAERVTAPVAKKMSAEEIAAEKRSTSLFLPPQKFNYVNNAKTVTYPYNVTVAQIAKTYKLSPEQVVKYNDLKNEYEPLPAKHNIFLQTKTDKAETKTHLVETNETLWSIAQKYGITIASLCDKNKLTPNLKLVVGEKLYLKNDAPKAPKFNK